MSDDQSTLESPPPPPARRRSRFLLHAVGAALTVAAFAVGLVVGDDGDSNEQTAAATASSAPVPSTATISAPPTTVAKTAATPEAPALTAPPGPGPPVPFTSVQQVALPADVAALRAVLDQLGFPDWWPMPDTVAPLPSGLPTVQFISASDSVLNPGTTSAFASITRFTTWLIDAPDMAAAEAVFVPKIPARFDVAAALAEKNTTITDGTTEVTYAFRDPAESYAELYLTISDAMNPDTGERFGTLVTASEGDPGSPDRPAPVPTGDAPAKQFLALAPASRHMEWWQTNFTASGGFHDNFTSSPSGSFRATWRFESDDMDEVIEFVSDPANFTGDLEILATGVFISEQTWIQVMTYQGLLGEYTMGRPEPGQDGYLQLEFKLEEP